jgi:putative ABC transport system ATP-binding protein
MTSKSSKKEKTKNGILIRTRNLWKVYNSQNVKTIALKEINLDISMGSFTAILGPSGSGKSTLLHLLAGLDKPTVRKNQQIIINNISLLEKNESELAKFRAENVGFVLQFFGLLPTLTALENVMMAGYFGGKKASERKALAKRDLSK